jgi:multidrug efflux system membrane fusion protein
MSKKIAFLLTLGVIVAAVIFIIHGRSGKQNTMPEGRNARGAAGKALPVGIAIAKRGDIDVVINALGTVTARITTTVKPRVDGQLIRIHFNEGQQTRKGQVLAEIDPRTFQAQLDQARGQLMRDQALLASARTDLKRYTDLLAKDSIASQQVSDQAALVKQYEGTVKADQAQVDSDKLQLDFTRITAPVSGRLGLRQVDVGNMIHASDASGLVVITQTQPIDVVFSIPSDQLDSVTSRFNHGTTLHVDAYDRSGTNKLASGRLLAIDNQIDPATGTVKLKAEFGNVDNALFPNQFVNASLRVETLHDATLIPSAAIQRGTMGTFVYVVDADKHVSIRPVTTGPTSGETVAISKGLSPGETVVIDGTDKLRDGSTVEPIVPGSTQESKPVNRRHKPGQAGGTADKNAVADRKAQ